MLWMVMAVAMLTLGKPCWADEPPEMFADMLHADVPLYTFEWENMWPRSFTSGDDFGCLSAIRFGDWQFTPASDNPNEDARWERFSNYGVIHCAAIFRTADDRKELENAEWRYGYFVKIGTGRRDEHIWDLWAIQSGTRPGSEYRLLAHDPEETTPSAFRVLQQRCPTGWYREGKRFDIWPTRYCVVHSRADLLTLARRMLALPARGTLTLVAKSD
ncbi:hypothetical protein ASE91_11390 [Sphingomonas sp. Leaf62]|nr:hypothetical protein ASE91_11390 [Sphingomonas sp. Leaf62]